MVLQELIERIFLFRAHSPSALLTGLISAESRQRLDGRLPDNCNLLGQYSLQVDFEMSFSQLNQERNLSLSHFELLLQLFVDRFPQLCFETVQQPAGSGLVRFQELADSLEVDPLQIVQIEHQSFLSVQLFQCGCQALRYHFSRALNIAFFYVLICSAMRVVGWQVGFQIIDWEVPLMEANLIDGHPVNHNFEPAFQRSEAMVLGDLALSTPTFVR